MEDEKEKGKRKRREGGHVRREYRKKREGMEQGRENCSLWGRIIWLRENI
jgi:hypothetical protein